VYVLISAEDLERRTGELARAIAADYAGRKVLCVGILKGSFMFLADLVRRIELPVEIDFLGVSSYGRGSTPGALRVTKDVDTDIAGRDVLVVEDICDTGQSLAAVRDLLLTRQPASLKTCILLDKPARRQVDLCPDYTGFEIPDAFVVGYGLDYAEQYRQLPYLAALEQADLDQKD